MLVKPNSGGMRIIALAVMLLFLPLVAKAEGEHPFWDQKNVQLHLWNLAAHSLDAYSTQRGLSHGAVEGNPVARPFVSRGWGGQVAASYGIGFGGTLLTSYILHRKGSHRLERFTTMFIASSTTLAAGLNFRF